jgi:amino acid permease
MGLVFGFLVGILTLIVLAFCVLGAMWESVRVHKDLKKLEQQWRRQPPP